MCGNRIDRPVGSVVYTQLLDERGGIVGDVTVTRLGEDRFRVVTGAGAVDGDRGFLELHAAGDVAIDDVTDELAVIGIWGPAAREALAAVTGDDVSNEAFPFRTAKAISIGSAPVLAQRITYVGELGYELYAARRDAVQVWDALMQAASPEPVGYTALDSLRIEKGYRYLRRRPDGLRHAVRGGPRLLRRAGTSARSSTVRRPQRLRTLVVGGEDYLTLYGGEAVHRDGAVIGRVRSAAYGFTVRRNVALAKLPSELEEGAEVHVDVLRRARPRTRRSRLRCTTRRANAFGVRT